MLKYIPVEQKNVNTQLLNIPTGEREPFTNCTPVQKRHRHPYLRFICGIKSNSQALFFIFFYFWDELSHKVKIVQPNFSFTFTFLFKIIFRLICVETPWLNTNRVQGEILSKMLQSEWTQFSLQCWQFCNHHRYYDGEKQKKHIIIIIMGCDDLICTWSTVRKIGFWIGCRSII